MKSIIFAIFTLLPALSFGANFNDSFSMLPMRYESKMKLGETKEFPIKIRNDMKTRKLINYQITLQEFVFEKDGKINAFPKTKNIRSLVPFARISNTKINLDPGKDVIVKVVITVPKDYKGGSGYLAFKLTQDDTGKKPGVGIGFKKNVIGFVAINVDENTKKNVELSNFSFKNGTVRLDLNNIGESYLMTSAKAVVIQGNKKIGEFDLIDTYNREKFLLIPELTRTLSAIIPKSIKNTKDMKLNVIVSDVSSNYIYIKEFKLKD